MLFEASRGLVRVLWLSGAVLRDRSVSRRQPSALVNEVAVAEETGCCGRTGGLAAE